jgi:hypothetical protein
MADASRRCIVLPASSPLRVAGGHRGAIEIIKLAWTSETFAYDGHFIWLDQGLSVHERAMEKLERLAAQLMPGPK